MRILQVLHNYKFGGAEQHLIQLCDGLRSAGHIVEIATPKDSWLGGRLLKAGFLVHHFNFRGHYDVFSITRLVSLLSRERYDLVHTHLVRAAHYGKIATKWTNTPLICSIHDLNSCS